MKTTIIFSLLVWLLVIFIFAGCANQVPAYQQAPAWLIPNQPHVSTIMAADLSCLSDDTYIRLAERDRACWQHVKELRAVLGVASE